MIRLELPLVPYFWVIFITMQLRHPDIRVKSIYLKLYICRLRDFFTNITQIQKTSTMSNSKLKNLKFIYPQTGRLQCSKPNPERIRRAFNFIVIDHSGDI